MEKDAGFVHLHNHSEFSMLDGLLRLEELVKTAREFKMPAVAITDHGNIFGAVKFYELAVGEGIKPIIGCEVYLARKGIEHKEKKQGSPYHLVLLCADEEGYRNLCRLITISYLEGFYYKPRIDHQLLEKHSRGLIALTSCLQGEIPQLLLSGEEKKAEEKLGWYQEIFGRENFYLELQDNGLEEQSRLNQMLISLSQKTGAPLVCTNDCHYLKPEDARLQEILFCIDQKKKIDDPNRFRLRTDQLYFRSPEEMKHRFREVPEAIKNTLKIAEQCNFYFRFDQLHLPTLELGEDETVEEKLEKQARKGFEEKLAYLRACYPDFARKEPEYQKRFDYELEIIKTTGFAGYFLIVADLVNYAREKQIPVGPGRGSSAGSLVAYSLGITNVDPIRYGLLFERFLTPERKEIPDIDVDFCQERRGELIKYAQKRYGGKEKVVQLITYQKLGAKAVVRDVGRVLNFPFSLVDRLAKLIPNDPELDLKKIWEIEPRLRELVEEEPKLKELFEIASQLEGLPRNPGTHAAGVVISDQPITEYMPLFKRAGEKEPITTQFDGDSVAKMGLAKFDLLGLRNLTVIDHAIKLIKQTRGIELNINAIPLDDGKTFELFKRGETLGIFQMESKGMTQLAVRLAPDRIEDLIAIIALYRPGPLMSGMVDDFILRKHGEKPIEYLVPALKEILEETYGVILYQEQVMQIAQKLAGYSAGEADRFRKAMGKKIREIMEQERERFVKGCLKSGLSSEQADRLFETISYFAGYGFNKAHSTGYALIAYQTAYLKAHFPLEYLTALLNSEINRTDKLVVYLREAKRIGLEVIPPHINSSFWEFTIKDGKILYGLGAIKNVGKKAVEQIVKERTEQGEFSSIFDFCERVDLTLANRRVIESLVKAGAFDGLGANRAQLLAVLDQAMESGIERKRSREQGQGDFFQILGKESSQPETLVHYPEISEWDLDQKLEYEREVLGHYLSGHPLVKYKMLIEKINLMSAGKISTLESGQAVTLCGVVSEYSEKNTRKKERMANFLLEDLTGRIEVVVFPATFQEVAERLKNHEEPVVVQGRVRIENQPQVIAEKIYSLPQALEEHFTQVHFWIPVEESKEEILKELQQLVSELPGKSRVVLHFRFPDQGEVVLRLPDSLRIKPGMNLAEKYQELISQASPNLEMRIL